MPLEPRFWEGGAVWCLSPLVSPETGLLRVVDMSIRFVSVFRGDAGRGRPGSRGRCPQLSVSPKTPYQSMVVRGGTASKGFSMFQHHTLSARLATPSVLSAILILSSAASSAAEKDTQLAPVVVTAARSEQLQAHRLADVTVIDAETIARSGQSSLGDLLQQEHGIELSSSGGAQSTTGVLIRGSNPGHTLVLIDGMRIGSSTAGGASLNALPLSQVERIEILRGPSSSLYGSDAIGGVINIITRKGRGAPRFNAEGGMGNRGTRKAAMGATGSSGALSYALQLAHDESDGFSSLIKADPDNPYDSYNPDRDGYARHSASSRLAWDWAAGHTLAAQALYSELDGQFDGVPGYDDREKVRVSSAALSSTDKLGEQWTSRIRLGQTIDDSTTDYGGYVYRYRTRQVQAGWQNDVVFNRSNSLTLGVDRLEEHIGAGYTGAGIPDERITHSLVGVYQLHVGKQRLQVNLHHDHSSQYGDETTGGLQYGYQLLPVLRLSGSLGTAFHAPSFNDLYYPGYGRTTIQPERSFNRELGLYLNGKGYDGSVVAFHNQVDDLIAYQYPCTTPGYADGCAANVKNATLRGVSLAGRLVRGNTSAGINADWQKPTDDDTGKRLPRRARLHGGVNVTQQIAAFTLGMELQGSSGRFDDTANAVPLAGYGVVNVFGSFQFARAWNLLLRVNNATDKDYQLASGYATEGTSLFVGLRFQQ